jgi:hypothetical protein
MDLLEAYKYFPDNGEDLRIYEFRGKVKKRIETADERGQLVTRLRWGKLRSVCVVAESLFDAVAHLKEYRPDFFPNHANVCGAFFRSCFANECEALDSDSEKV